jgi:spermidine/putrescine transport system permease protein
VHRVGRWFADHWVMLIGLVVLGYLFLPIVVVFLLSVTRPAGRLSYEVTGDWTAEYWLNPFAPIGLGNALSRSILIGLIATAVATMLGTLMSFGLVRHRFRGRSSTNVLIFLPMATPEVVMGSSLLALFVATKIPLGFGSILIAHILFCLSFVVVTVKARLAGMDPRLQEAAMDLYANEWQTFRRVTLPLVMPGIVAAALLAFSLSFDDFIVTNFTAGSGSIVTFPLFVWGSSQRGIPREVNVVGTAMFLIALVFVLAGQVLGRRRVRT